MTRRMYLALVLLGAHSAGSLASRVARAEEPQPTAGTTPSFDALPDTWNGSAALAVRSRAAAITALPDTTPEPALDREGEATAARIQIRPPQWTHHAVPAFHRAPKDTVDPASAQRRMLGFIAGSLGLAGVGLGATTSVIVLAHKEPLDRQCVDPIRICSPDGKVTTGGHHSLATVSAAGWAIGVLGLGTGAALILSSNPKTRRETALGTNFYRGGAGLKVTRTF